MIGSKGTGIEDRWDSKNGKEVLKELGAITGQSRLRTLNTFTKRLQLP
jgi:hypothetical protein